MNNSDLVVDGFVFLTTEEAQAAREEYDSIQVIKQKIKLEDKDNVYMVYQKLNDRKLLKTPIGYVFLKQLRNILINDFSYDPKDLEDITLTANISTIHTKYNKTEDDRRLLIQLKGRMRRYKQLVGVLIVIVIAMFVITATNKNVGYVNVENKILDKYADWEEELNMREADIEKREAQLEE